MKNNLDSNVIVVTHRHFFSDHASYLKQVSALSAAKPRALLLREKDMSEIEYEKLVEQVLPICRENAVPCILHHFTSVAQKLAHPLIHLPFAEFKVLTEKERHFFKVIGVSCHSEREAVQAEKLGATYINVGTIYPTASKPGRNASGVERIQTMHKVTDLPIYAIGGITPERYPEVRAAGATGACVMGGAMKAEDPAGYLSAFANANKMKGGERL